MFEWFEMNVARPVLNRLEEDEIDEADDGGRIRVGLDFGDGCVVVPEGQEFARGAELLEDVLHAGGVGAVVGLEPLFNLLRGRDDDVNVFAEGKMQVFRCARVERINQGHGDPVLVCAER